MAHMYINGAMLEPRPSIQTVRSYTAKSAQTKAELTKMVDANASTSSLPNITLGSGAVTPSENLGHEVAALNDKLIRAINHQTTLEEGLEDTKTELLMSKDRIRQLEATAKEHADMMAKGVLVEKKDVEMETRQLMNKLLEESKQRGKAEKEKKNIEMDLENLTSSLFEEANKMVIAARKEREAVLKRNDQLEQQLQDTEILLQTHQEQLSELKMALVHMSVEKEESESSSTPSTPALNNSASKESLHRIYEALHIGNGADGTDEIAPAHPTSFSHLIEPVLRTDTVPYHDFQAVTRIPKQYASAIVNRQASGSVSSFTGPFNVLGSSTPKHERSPSSSSSMFGHALSKSLSSLQNSQSTSPAQQQQPAPLLKDTVFFKRALAEDIEPTLRLDIAPGLSWVSRRTVLASIIDGSLVIEAMPNSSKLPIFNCTLCDESRNDPQHVRTHRFRTNETSAAQRYPMCSYCAQRLRSVCAFMSFMRMIKEGHWRVDTEEDEKRAWEESVRLREQMFWSRIGGGVVPASSFTTALKEDLARSSANSPRTSTDETAPTTITALSDVTSSSHPRAILGNEVALEKAKLDSDVHHPLPLPPREQRPDYNRQGMSLLGSDTELEKDAQELDVNDLTKTPSNVTATEFDNFKTTVYDNKPSLQMPVDEQTDADSIASKRTRDSQLPSPPASPSLNRNISDYSKPDSVINMPGGFS